MISLSYRIVLFVNLLLFDVCFWKINSITVPIEIPPDTTDSNVEHLMTYWREDIGLNGFHWHWHLYHSCEGPEFIVKKDRRGELFYYLHHQIMARYNIERHCNSLNFISPFSNWDEPIEEAYFPYLLSSDVAGRDWSPRPAGMRLSDINRPDFKKGVRFNIGDLKHYSERILEAVDRKFFIDTNHTEVSIDSEQGIDILTNAVEASILSPNPAYYGSLHNLGHAAVGFIHDPQGKKGLPGGVMSLPNTSLRDPFFYKWHSFLNNIFLKHKNSLQPYHEKDLSFSDIKVTNVELHSHKNGKYKSKKNTLNTYMMKSAINMSRGIDFFPRSPVSLRSTHLSHDEFEYTIEYVNSLKEQLLGAVRIFIMPVIGPGNYPMKLSEQRNLAIEMDRFVQPLKPGVNKIVRKSTMSSMTIPYEQTFRDVDTDRPGDEEYKEFEKFNSCGCGWPQHLLVPRGTADGYPMILFAIITDYNAERPNQNGNATLNDCRLSQLCALTYGNSYPYKRAVGFPFDRSVIGLDSIQAFLTSNMAIKPITIFHSDKGH